MMTEKQIVDLRKVVRHYRWMPGLMLVLCAFQIMSAAAKLFFVQRLCRASDLTWGQAWASALSKADITQTYAGLEVRAAGAITAAVFYFGCAFLFGVFFFVARLRRDRDTLLLELIDERRGTQPEHGETTQDSALGSTEP